MKVIYESYLRRHRGNNNNNGGNNNNNGNNNSNSGSSSTGNNNNGNNTIEICHPGDYAVNKMKSGVDLVDKLSAPRSNFVHMIQCDSLVINKELGVGEFGIVQQGVWTNQDGRRIQVAIKCLSASRLENNRQEFLKEAAIMHAISHDHIVMLYGVVLEPSVMLVTELAPLRSLLECLKEPTLVSHFPVTSLCTFAAQIANGMAYLESKRLIHRDLAARNILVFTKNVVKISDFGLSRALGVGKDYYKSNFNVNLKLPIAWCAPECINYLKFTSQSDVWAYGVTMWEMFSFGFQPWAALTGQQILKAIDEPSYQRLEQPVCCPKEYYQLMLRCWSHEPNSRPRFSEIVGMLPDCRPELLQAIRNSSANVNCNTTTSSSTSNSNSTSDFSNEFLPYRTGDIVTVIDKTVEPKDSTFESCWKGVNNERKTGYFSPNDFVAYLGQNLPSSSSSSAATATNHSIAGATNSTNSNSSNSFVNFLSGGGHNNVSNNNSSHQSYHTNGHHNNHNHNHHHHHSNSFASTITSTVLQSSKFIRGFLESKSHHNNHHHGNNHSNDSSPHGLRKNTNHNHRLRPEMISKPQGDFKHTGHVGADGIFFGDVSFLEGKYHHLPKTASTNSSLDSNENHHKSSKKYFPSISNPINSFARNSGSSNHNGNINWTSMNGKEGENYLEENHEYHEISDEDDLGPLESPPFEVFDFGPSLMEEVFRELDHIKPDLSSETAESETAINENGINVKNEVRELNLKMCKEAANNSRKKQSSVKPITEAEQNELDSAIAMAKDIANRTMLEDDLLDLAKSDSPKTPNSPNKRKFSFKFPSHKSSPKAERRTFSEETESIGNIIESITPAAKEAYLSLVEKGVSIATTSTATTATTTTTNAKKDCNDKRPDVKPPPPPPVSQTASPSSSSSFVSSSFSSSLSTTTTTTATATSTSTTTMMTTMTNSMNNDNDLDIGGRGGNPLRMLRTAGISNVLRPKVRGNRSFSQPRLPTTAQTAGLARVASSSRSQLGSPPPVPGIDDQSSQVQSHQQQYHQAVSSLGGYTNALPLPPRDRTRPLIQLKTHQRRHPLVIPAEMARTNDSNNVSGGNAYASFGDYGYDQNYANETEKQQQQHHHHRADSPPLLHRHVPVLKQVSCPQAPAAFLNVYNNNHSKAATNSNSNSNQNSAASINASECDKINSVPLPPPKPNRTYLTDDLTESLESEMQKAFDNIKLSQSMVSSYHDDSGDKNNDTVAESSAEPIEPAVSSSQVIAASSISSINTTNTQAAKIGVTVASDHRSTNDLLEQKESKSKIATKSNVDLTTTPNTTNGSSGVGNNSINSATKRNIDCDEVRVMQKVLGNEANLSAEECAEILGTTDWDIHKAIKCVRLRQQLRSHNITVECNWAQMLNKFNWNIRHASNYLIATQGVPEDTTEV